MRNDVQANDDFIARRSYYWMPYCIYIHKGFKKEGMKESTFGPLLLRPFVLVINVFLTYDNFQHQIGSETKGAPTRRGPQVCQTTARRGARYHPCVIFSKVG